MFNPKIPEYPCYDFRTANTVSARTTYLFSFESIDRQGRALNLGETVILQSEINPFISALRKQKILVTALHNHWLFEKPRLMYIHFESIENPITFARKVQQALKVLKG